MPINEVFPNPVIKQVAFEIRFPNLFFMESRIGDFQMKVMKAFPESQLLLKRHILFAEGEPKKIEELIAGNKEEGSKVWQFKSPKGVSLAITSKSLSISSEQHKTYSLGEADRFRDTIDEVLRPFFDLTSIPTVTRLGLRYIDECPVPSRNTEEFLSYYNTTLPVRRFALDRASVMEFVAVVQRDACQLRIAESVKFDKDKTSLILDYDAWVESVEVAKVLETTDVLHQTIRTEFENSVKEPVFEYMRRQPGK